MRDKGIKIVSNPGYDCYERRLASMFYKFFDKNSAGSGTKSIPNQQVPDELHKLGSIIRKFSR